MHTALTKHLGRTCERGAVLFSCVLKLLQLCPYPTLYCTVETMNNMNTHGTNEGLESQSVFLFGTHLYDIKHYKSISLLLLFYIL